MRNLGTWRAQLSGFFLISLLAIANLEQIGRVQGAPAPSPDSSSTNPPAETPSPPFTPVATNAPPVEPPATNLPPAEPPATNAIPAQPAQTTETAEDPEANQLSGFELRSGFRMEVVASEPLTISPVAIAFDENGRMFVVERDDSSPETANAGRLRVLEDAEGEGSFSASTLFADDLRRPSAVTCYEGGVFVAATPDILYLKDTLARGTGDVRRVAFTGFGVTNTTTSGPLIGALAWGPDNRFHGISGGLQGRITSPIASAFLGIDLAESDFSFDPRTLWLRPEAGPSQSGLAFHPDRVRFVSDFARPLRRTMYALPYYHRAPFFAPARELVDIVEPGLGVHVHPESDLAEQLEPPTSSTAIRSRTNFVPTMPMQEARGTAIYASGLFPTNYFGNAFIADPATRVVHRAVLRQQAFAWTAGRGPDDQRTEFLRSSDPDFRPMQIVQGPEGALYIVDARRDGQSGRIYRITPEGWTYRKPPAMGQMKTYDLVASLVHSNAWQRETAARLLFEREDKTNAVPLLGNMLARSRSPVARVNALYALDAMAALNEKVILLALRSNDERLREAGVKLSEGAVSQQGDIPEAIWNQLAAMVDDPSVRVRYQLAFTLGAIRHRGKPALLAGMLRRELANPWFRTAILSSLARDGAEAAVQLASDRPFMANPLGYDFVRALGLALGMAGRPDDLVPMVDYLLRNEPPPITSFTLLAAVGEGLERRGLTLSAVDPELQLRPFYVSALSLATGTGTPEPLRLAALRLLAASPMDYSEIGDLTLLQLINRPLAPELRQASLWLLAQFGDPRLGTNILNRWSAIPPEIRSDVLTAFMARPNRIPLLLDVVAAGRVPPEHFTSTQVRFLQTLPDPAINQQALELLGLVSTERQEVLDRYRPALELPGNASRGRSIFGARCAQCHEINGQGQRVGPSLDRARVFGKASILTAILEPNLQVRPGYQTALVQTANGLLLYGVRERENPDTVILVHPLLGPSAWPRGNMILYQVQPWSMMPQGLEQGLSPQDMADLLGFLMAP